MDKSSTNKYPTNKSDNIELRQKYNPILSKQVLQDEKEKGEKKREEKEEKKDERDEIEIFRLKPEEGKYYETAEYTRCVGRWPNEKYYTSNNLRYVGKFIKHESSGYGDAASHRGVFLINGNKEIVNYTYEGTTSFREVIKSNQC